MQKKQIAKVVLSLTFAVTSVTTFGASLSGTYTCLFNRSFAGFHTVNKAFGGNPTSTVNGLAWINFDTGVVEMKTINTTKYEQSNAGTEALTQFSGTVAHSQIGTTGNRFKIASTFSSGTITLAAVRVNSGNSLYAVYPYSDDPSDRFSIEPAYLVCNK